MDATEGGPATYVLPTKTTRSCTECTRRKTKCDRLQPCGACVKRGQAHTCVTKQPSKRGPDPSIVLDERRQAALSEISLFRSTLLSLEARLPSLEYFIANSATRSPAADGDGRADDQDEVEAHEGQHASTSAAASTTSRHGEDEQMDRIVRSFGNPVTALNPASSSRMGHSNDVDSRQHKRAKHAHNSAGEETEGENSAVEASVNLEFMTLGRPRNYPDHQNTKPTQDGQPTAPLPFSASSILAPNPPQPSPLVLFPDMTAILKVAPTSDEEETILNHGFHRFAWHHSVVHPPTFASQVAAFWELGENKFEQCSPAWLSLYFAVLAVSSKLLNGAQQQSLGWSQEQASQKASDYFNCSVACLYRQNYLANYDLFSLQAIALVVMTGRDTGSAALIANLLASGLSVAQDLNLHKQCSDQEWDARMKDQPQDIRSKALIDRETRKRVLWAMAHSDWFAAPFRHSWILGRSRITTPLPLNCTDEDLASGNMVNRPMTEYTSVSWLLMYVKLATCMQVAFEHSVGGKKGNNDYDAFLQIDNQLEAILADVPPWLKEGNDASGAPPDQVELMRSTFRITAQHKILSIHRPFLAWKKRPSYTFSRRRVVIAARAILREAPQVHGVRIWTVLYHLSVALFSVTLELFEQVKNPTAEADAMREEIVTALPVLEELQQSSSIADRGIRLVIPLLEEEKRQRELAKKRARKPRKSNLAQSTTSPSSASTALPRPDSAADLNVGPSGTVTGMSTAVASRATSDAGASTGGGQPLPSPDTTSIPSWYFGDDSWLDTQLTGTPGALANMTVPVPAMYDPNNAAAFPPPPLPMGYSGYPLMHVYPGTVMALPPPPFAAMYPHPFPGPAPWDERSDGWTP